MRGLDDNSGGHYNAEYPIPYSMPRSPHAAWVWPFIAAGLLMQSAWAGVDVKIEGLDSALRQNVELRLGIAVQRGRGDLDQALVEALHHDADADIRAALQPFGYYNPEVDGTLQGQAPDWSAHYRIKAGPVTHLDRADVRLGLPLRAPAVHLAEPDVEPHGVRRRCEEQREPEWQDHPGHPLRDRHVLGEEWRDRLDMMFTLREIGVDVMPTIGWSEWLTAR